MPDYPSIYHARIARALERYAQKRQDPTPLAGVSAPARDTDGTMFRTEATMIAAHAQEVQPMETIQGEDLALLTQLMEQMKTQDPWRMPPTKMLHAFTAVRERRIQADYPPGLWHVTGTRRKDGTVPTYTVTDTCTCDDSQKYGHSKYCYHMAAVELEQRYQRAQAEQRQTSLFVSPPTIDARLAAAPAATINVITGEITETEEPPVQTDTLELPVEPEMPLEAPRMPQEPSMPAQVLRVTPRPISAIVADLSRPFPKECLCTLQKSGRSITFVHWHTVAALLDSYAPGWQGSVVRVEKVGEKIAVTYRISIPAAEGVCSREDSGMEDEDKDDFGDAMTNAIATAFKRAAAKFGVGRDQLYDTDQTTKALHQAIRKEREDLLKALGEAADAAGIPRAKLSDWLKRETARHRNADIPAWALRDVLMQLQALAPDAA